jgi:class 3 adenylate cyclase
LIWFGAAGLNATHPIILRLSTKRRLSGEPLTVCVGLNAGEPIEEDGDLFGATVILASRIAA